MVQERMYTTLWRWDLPHAVWGWDAVRDCLHAESEAVLAEAVAQNSKALWCIAETKPRRPKKNELQPGAKK